MNFKLFSWHYIVLPATLHNSRESQRRSKLKRPNQPRTGLFKYSCGYPLKEQKAHTISRATGGRRRGSNDEAMFSKKGDRSKGTGGAVARGAPAPGQVFEMGSGGSNPMFEPAVSGAAGASAEQLPPVNAKEKKHREKLRAAEEKVANAAAQQQHLIMTRLVDVLARLENSLATLSGKPAAPAPPPVRISYTGRDRQTVPVTMNFEVSNIMTLDAAESRFEADIFVTLSWCNPMLAAANADGTLQVELGADAWERLTSGNKIKRGRCATFDDVVEHMPLMEVMNQIELKETADEIQLEDRETGRVSLVMRYQGFFEEPFELQAFPFDHQALDIRLQFLREDAYNYSMEAGDLSKNSWYGTWDYSEDGKWIETNQEWRFRARLNHNLQSVNDYPVYAMRISAARRWGYYVHSIAVVLCLLVLLQVGTLLAPPTEFSDRLANTFTLLLTVVAFKIVLGERLPKCSYLTIADKYITCAFALLSIAGFQCMLSFSIAVGKGPWSSLSEVEALDHAENIDTIFVMGYSAFWLLVHVWLGFDVGRQSKKAHLEQASALA